MNNTSLKTRAALEQEIQRLNDELKRRDDINAAFQVHEKLTQPPLEKRIITQIQAVCPKAALCSTTTHAIRVLIEEYAAATVMLVEKDKALKAISSESCPISDPLNVAGGTHVVTCQRFDIIRQMANKALSLQPESAFTMYQWNEKNATVLRKAIEDCINYSNGRDTEWGERAEACFEILRKGLEDGKH